MPFTSEDAEKHKKGMTDKMKKQWARVAESVRKRMMKKGMSEEEAAGEAVKQANGVVMNANESKGLYSVYKNKQILDYEVKLTVHQEKAHLVIPVVMMVEGVHNGNQGPIFHSMAELGKFPESWNGIPVVITHPKDEGQAVSANSPDIIDKMTVGRVYNTVVDGKKLKAEVWLDEDKLNTLSEKTLEDVNETKEVEVSLGMFTENEDEEGDYEGKHYIKIAHNHRPDHLAILPDQVGACSVEDGCGIGANEKNKNMEIKVETAIKLLRIGGFSINEIGNHADQGYNERMNMIYDKLRSLDTNKTYNYLEEFYDDYLIYSVSGDNNRKMYKQTYKIESGKIEFVGEPVEVHKKVEYIVNNSLTRTKISTNNKKEDKNMPKNECPKCLVKINTVITNKESGFVEADREWLETLSEAALDKTITPRVIEKEKIVEKIVEVNKFTPAQEADLAFVAKQRAEKRNSMIQGIQANTEKGTWDDITLNAMSEDLLEKVFKSVKKEDAPVDYSLMSVHGFSANASAEEALYPGGVVIETKK